MDSFGVFSRVPEESISAFGQGLLTVALCLPQTALLEADLLVR